jgi:hypothetical protein
MMEHSTRSKYTWHVFTSQLVWGELKYWWSLPGPHSAYVLPSAIFLFLPNLDTEVQVKRLHQHQLKINFSNGHNNGTADRHLLLLNHLTIHNNTSWRCCVTMSLQLTYHNKLYLYWWTFIVFIIESLPKMKLHMRGQVHTLTMFYL